LLPAAVARAFLPLPGYDEVSGIDDVRVGGDAVWYSLDGRRLDDRNLKKGIYIHGGRKVVVK